MKFVRVAFKRILISSLLVSLLAGTIGWFWAVETSEQESVDMTVAASVSTFQHLGISGDLDSTVSGKLQVASDKLIGELFDIVEVYDSQGVKLIESLSTLGHQIESSLPPHHHPNLNEPHYESFDINQDWVLRIIVPIKINGELKGYLEGIRVVPDWQKEDITQYSIGVTLLTVGAVWLCSILIFPIITFLNKEHIRQNTSIRKGTLDMIFALGNAIALRDSDTGAHNYRVACMAVALGEALNLKRSDIRALLLGSFLHDVGKIAISDSIMLKPDKLTDDEMNIMRTHVDEGVQFVEGIDWLQDAAPVIGSHHEKWDGSGYPNQLKGEDIPLNARIFAIVDVFDALCSERPYKSAFSFETAMNILQEGKGSHFDGALLDAFEKIAFGLHHQLANKDEVVCREAMIAKANQYFFDRAK